MPWGFWGHKRINRVAVFTLPPEMLAFYKYHIEYITESAVNPDKRRYATKNEAPRHYIDVDHYGVYPFDNVPRRWNDAVEALTEDTSKAGSAGNTGDLLGADHIPTPVDEELKNKVVLYEAPEGVMIRVPKNNELTKIIETEDCIYITVKNPKAVSEEDSDVSCEDCGDNCQACCDECPGCDGCAVECEGADCAPECEGEDCAS